jgi:hypothetical protein
MSTLWTPGGEHPVGRPGDDERDARPRPPAASSEPLEPTDHADHPDHAAFEAELAAAREQLEQLPAVVVVAQLTLQLYELAAVHLSRTPPALAEARVAIDAMGAVIDALGARLGENEATLLEARRQLQAAFVELSRDASGATATESPKPPGDE